MSFLCTLIKSPALLHREKLTNIFFSELGNTCICEKGWVTCMAHNCNQIGSMWQFTPKCPQQCFPLYQKKKLKNISHSSWLNFRNNRMLRIMFCFHSKLLEMLVEYITEGNAAANRIHILWVWLVGPFLKQNYKRRQKKWAVKLLMQNYIRYCCSLSV